MKTFIDKDFNNNSLFNVKRVTVTNLDLSTAENGVLTPKSYVDTELTALEEAINTALGSKSDVGHTHVEADITDLDKYTQNEVDTKLDNVSVNVKKIEFSDTQPTDQNTDDLWVDTSG